METPGDNQGNTRISKDELLCNENTESERELTSALVNFSFSFSAFEHNYSALFLNHKSKHFNPTH